MFYEISCYNTCMRIPFIEKLHYKNKDIVQHKLQQKRIFEMTPKEYEQLGRKMEQVFVSGYASRWRLFIMSFYKGIGYGFGIFIGGSIVVGLLVWLMGQFESVNVLKPVVEFIRTTYENSQEIK